MAKKPEKNLIDVAEESLLLAADSLKNLSNELGDEYLEAVELLKQCNDLVITTGVGKSGHVAQKLAATLTSTGKPAVFLNPSNALHGDLGMVNPGSVLIAISYSGETPELLALTPALRHRNTPIISITGYPDSQLAKLASVSLVAAVKKEACPLNLAPTTSIIAALGIADALAIGLMVASNYKAEEFAVNHPAGSLGRRLTVTVGDLMENGSEQFIVSESADFTEILAAITDSKLGAVCVGDEHKHLVGIITDGDIRRTLQKYSFADLEKLKATELMTRNPSVTHRGVLAADALIEMELRHSQISVLPIVDEDNVIQGIVRVHDIVRAGI